MSERQIRYRGEIFISIEETARSFGIDRRLIVEWAEHHLIETPRRVGDVDAIPARDLDRIAALIRYAKVLDLDVTTIRALIELGRLGERD